MSTRVLTANLYQFSPDNCPVDILPQYVDYLEGEITRIYGDRGSRPILKDARKKHNQYLRQTFLGTQMMDGSAALRSKAKILRKLVK